MLGLLIILAVVLDEVLLHLHYVGLASGLGGLVTTEVDMPKELTKETGLARLVHLESVKDVT